MPGPVGGEQHRRNIAALRIGGFVLAVALGAVAIWLIVTSTSQKRIEIGILAGLWGLLVGAYSVFGSRQVYQPVAGSSGREVELRESAQPERGDDAAQRREFPSQLLDLLRREHEGVAHELADLRAEVASLRSDLVEKVNGQIRLERIETTRLIGSDLEALQAEVRQLKLLQPVGADGDEAPVVSLGEPAALPARPSAADGDPFAGLPRIRPFTDPDAGPAVAAGLDQAARHSSADADATSGGGRRHRSDDAGDDVLARVLARETSR